MSATKRITRMPKYFLHYRRFKNATWILTDKHSGNKTEYNYSEMCKVVKEAYVSNHNKSYSEYPYNCETLDVSNVAVRWLDERSCLISEIRKSVVVSKLFNEILLEYSVDCYGWYYQCRKCDYILAKSCYKGKKE